LLSFQSLENQADGMSHQRKKSPEPQTPTGLGHRRRLRDRFLKTGSESLHAHELLELLLAVAVPRVDTKKTAWSLLKKYGTLAAVFDAPPRELQRVMGVGPAAACALKIVKASATAYLKSRLEEVDVLTSPSAVTDYCRIAFAGEPNESLKVLMLDSRNRVRKVVRLSEGTVDQAAAYPRRVVEAALEARATGVLLVHNHPSGAIEPSAEDEKFTLDAQRALQTVGIRLVDHLIVGREGSLSFRETGCL
jgi:DNA repair protein RadC